MAVRRVSGDELVAALTPPADGLEIGDLVVATEPPTGTDPRHALAAEALRTLPCVVVGAPAWTDAAPPIAALVDVVADEDDLAAIEETMASAPRAAAALAVHLRGQPAPSIGAGLAAESALYSLLLGGDEFRTWRATTPVRERAPATGPPVVVHRDGDELHVELARPEVRNALGTELRDALLDALAVAEADPSLRLRITGQGPAFCAGGHLDEFGSAPDPITAHEIRLTRSIGAVLARLAPRTTVALHGACYGAGIELPAFAGHVVAAPDTSIALPELGLGLVPGAGGTVSLPHRIGRHRAAWLALTRQAIDARTALDWGLVDALT